MKHDSFALLSSLSGVSEDCQATHVDEVISNLEWRFGLRGKQENMIGFEQNPYLRGLNLLPDIIDAATSHQAVRITYRNYKNCDEEYTVVVHPWYIKQYNNRWFLMAYDAEADRISNYALDRIQNFNVDEDVAYIPNKEVDFEHYFDDVFGVTIPPSDVEKIRVLLQFSKKQYPYIVSKPLHHSQEIVDAGNRILAVEVRPTYEFTQLILRLDLTLKCSDQSLSNKRYWQIYVVICRIMMKCR